MTSQIFRITNLHTDKIGPKLWRLDKPLIFGFRNGPVTVPTNFITDGASCPRILYSLCTPMSGPHAEAAVLHDWLYSRDSGPGLSRKQCDEIFYDVMIANGTGTLRAKMIYQGVRMGGMKSFKACYSIDKLEQMGY